MALAGGVSHQAGVAGAEYVLGAVAQANFQLARQDNHVLGAGRRMPVLETSYRGSPEGDGGCVLGVGPVRGIVQVNGLDVGSVRRRRCTFDKFPF